MAETEDEADREEQAALARAEATVQQAAANRAAVRGVDPPTPEVDLGHLPLAVRGPADRITEWVVHMTIHLLFSAFCRTESNRKLKDTTDLVQSSTDVSSARYFESIKHCKNIGQWMARLLAVGMPAEGVAACKTMNEVGRLMGLMLIHGQGVGEPISADLRSREYWVGPELQAWLA